MSAVESDRLLAVRAQREECISTDGRMNRCSTVCRALPLLVILICVQRSTVGFVYSVSYFTIPVRSACSPPWSKSVTVYIWFVISNGCRVSDGLVPGSFDAKAASAVLLHDYCRWSVIGSGYRWCYAVTYEPWGTPVKLCSYVTGWNRSTHCSG